MKLAAFLLLLISINTIIAQNLPYPQQFKIDGSIKPNHKAATELDIAVTQIYETWKDDFLKPTELNGGYYVHGGCTGCQVESKGTSEGHGYGMIITALMAGYDSDAKKYFDGLFHFFNNYRSVTNNELMNWNVAKDEREAWTGSATDGDMDIAYALLLAHYQWGSDGDINYMQEAIDMINLGLKVSDMHSISKRVMLGDWDSDKNTTRPSDWMTGHFKAYAEATNDNFWHNATNTIYSITKNIITNYSPETGLLPDFIVGESAKPAAPNFLEGENDGSYYYNACRFPWRISTDYLHYNTNEAKQNLAKFLAWANNIVNGNFNNYTAGYKLNGTPLNDYTDMSFTAPLVLAFCTDSNYQNTLNLGWDYIENNYHSYFDASINVLCQLIITGNWWPPTSTIADKNSPDIYIKTPVHNSEINATSKVTFSFSGSDTTNIKSIHIYKENKLLGSVDKAPFIFEHQENKAGTALYKAVIKTIDEKYRILSSRIEVKEINSIKSNLYELSLYPNPSKNNISVDLKNEIPIYIEVYNYKGKKLSTPYSLNNNKLEINTQSLNTGVYCLLLYYTNHKKAMTFIKE